MNDSNRKKIKYEMTISIFICLVGMIFISVNIDKNYFISTVSFFIVIYSIIQFYDRYRKLNNDGIENEEDVVLEENQRQCPYCLCVVDNNQRFCRRCKKPI